MTEILGIIPARGGSKGIRKKNIALLADHPLIYYTITAAMNSKCVTRVIVSTEDVEIADVSKEYGAEVMERPENLVTDSSPTIDTVLHTLEQLSLNGYMPDMFVILQPTSPLRTSNDIDDAIGKLKANEIADSLISVSVPSHSIYKALRLNDQNLLEPVFEETNISQRRQDLPDAYVPNGALFIYKTAEFLDHKRILSNKTMAYIMDASKSVDIDTSYDLIVAERMIKGNDQNGIYGD